MTIDTLLRHITPADGNIFLDLGFPPEEASTLLAETDKVISEKRAFKESLITELAQWIARNHLKPAAAAQILGVTRRRVWDVIHQKSINFTMDALVDMVARTGKHVPLKDADA